MKPTLIASASLHALVLCALLLPSGRGSLEDTRRPESGREVLIGPRGRGGPPPAPLLGNTRAERPTGRSPLTRRPALAVAPNRIPDLTAVSPPAADATTGGARGGDPAGVTDGDRAGIRGGVPGGLGDGRPEGGDATEPGPGAGDLTGQDPAVPVVITPAVVPPELLLRVDPDYPKLALLAGLQGSVVLHCVIERDGSVRDCEVREGHPLLVGEAVRAILQWRYRPGILRESGRPIAVLLDVRVSFAGGE